MDSNVLKQFVDRTWDQSIVPALSEFIRIPNKSPHFDPDWAEHGHMDRAVALIAAWLKARPVRGMQVEVIRLEGRTPLVFAEIEGDSDDCVLLYGHLDKQPEFTGWRPDLGPWKPVLRDGRLYGRGGADDGYAAFASLTAIQALQQQDIPHARCVLIIEGCEESGSYDLPFYIDALAERIGAPSLVICLDAECGNYDQFWCTTSLRGNLVGTLRVGVLTEGVHSGGGSGIAASPFRLLRQLLSRIEDETTGDLTLEELYVEIPDERRAQAVAAAGILGDSVWRKLPFAGNAGPLTHDRLELVLNNTWRPTLVVTGADGLPAVRDAGNVLLPSIALKLSFRLPPTLEAEPAAAAVKRVLECDPPYGAEVAFKVDSAQGGWNAPPIADWLEASVHRASNRHFGAEAMYMGTGGTIPFMGMLGRRFPQVQFLVTGLLGPHANAHGPNEFLHLDCGRKLTACVAEVLADHHRR